MGDPLSTGLSWLSGQAQPMERLLRRLVEENSFTQNPPGVNAVADLAAAELSRLGLTVERIHSGRFGDHLAFAGPAPGPASFLVGHLDTVFPPGQFEGYQSDGRAARGPGVFDMKGGVVVMLFGLEAVAVAGLLPRVPVRGMLVSDEEVGSPESQPLIRVHAAGAACALCFESGREGDRIVTERKGVAAVHAEASGVAAHAGNDHAKGRSAVWALARFVDRAQALTDYRRGLTVNVGLFQGGATKNTVPDRARAEVDLRFATAADGDLLQERLWRAAAEAALEGTRIELFRSSGRQPMVRTPASAELARGYGECQRLAGLGQGEAPPAGGGSDACTTSAAGIPSIDGLGPRGAGYHTREEWIECATLVPKAEALFRFLAGRAS